MNKNTKICLLLISLFFLTRYTYAQSQLTTGIWRGALKTASGAEISFNFNVEDTVGKPRLVVFNGAERLKVPDVKLSGDSVFIHMPLFDSEFRLKLLGDSLAGRFIKHLGNKDAAMQFTARAGETWRILKSPKQPAYNLTGLWSAEFGEDAEKDQLVGDFKQTGSHITGTFLSTTGDYRYLEGVVSGNRLSLSCFDGGHAYLFTATIKDAKTLSDGKLYAGYSAVENWKAVSNPDAKLPDAYSLTALKPGYKKIKFSFKDIEGKEVSLTDSRYKNKVVIVQIMGSWCPNCMDETGYFVSSYYPKYHNKGVEIVGLAYERTTDFAKSQHTLAQLDSHFNVPYPLLITGFTPGKGDPEKSLPMLADFRGFPTTIIIDKHGDVRRIHTGFSGPGTGEYYTQFIDEFQKLTDDLLAEK